MGTMTEHEQILATVRGLEEHFRRCLPDFRIGISGNAHYKNGQTDDLGEGREFQFLGPASVYRVRFHSDFLADHLLADILERLDRWKLIERLRQNGHTCFLVTEQGICPDRE